MVLRWAEPAEAVVLWSDLGATLAHETGAGNDILGGALKRDDSASDTLYFKFHVDPLFGRGHGGVLRGVPALRGGRGAAGGRATR